MQVKSSLLAIFLTAPFSAESVGPFDSLSLATKDSSAAPPLSQLSGPHPFLDCGFSVGVVERSEKFMPNSGTSVAAQKLETSAEARMLIPEIQKHLKSEAHFDVQNLESYLAAGTISSTDLKQLHFLALQGVLTLDILEDVHNYGAFRKLGYLSEESESSITLRITSPEFISLRENYDSLSVALKLGVIDQDTFDIIYRNKPLLTVPVLFSSPISEEAERALAEFSSFLSLKRFADYGVCVGIISLDEYNKKLCLSGEEAQTFKEKMFILRTGEEIKSNLKKFEGQGYTSAETLGIISELPLSEQLAYMLQKESLENAVLKSYLDLNVAANFDSLPENEKLIILERLEVLEIEDVNASNAVKSGLITEEERIRFNAELMSPREEKMFKDKIQPEGLLSLFQRPPPFNTE